MSFDAKILADSLSPDGVRLTTMEVTFPRIILAEFNTHRMFSRNSASSRAIPVEKMIRRVREDPYIPASWGKNQKGMQADVELPQEACDELRHIWLDKRNHAVNAAMAMVELGLHKQTANRLLEPWLWQTCIVSATEWSNFFHLRNNAQAHPDIQTIARMMQELYKSNVPQGFNHGEWHLPLWDHAADNPLLANYECDEAGSLNGYRTKVSVARCARVSYLTHDGKRDIQADLDLHDKLLSSGHLSPFEHVARPWMPDDRFHALHDERLFNGNYAAAQWCGNLRGWVQYRKLIPNEADILGVRDA